MVDHLVPAEGALVDVMGAHIVYNDVKYYRDGVLYGHNLNFHEDDFSPEDERLMPDLWSLIVIQYRKKPVVVEAIQLSKDNVEEVATWCGGAIAEEIDPTDDEKRFVAINVPTLEGVMRASEGDYVIKGVKGEFYPCKPEIFQATYEIA